jgi:hypothetical protein
MEWRSSMPSVSQAARYPSHEFPCRVYPHSQLLVAERTVELNPLGFPIRHILTQLTELRFRYPSGSPLLPPGVTSPPLTTSPLWLSHAEVSFNHYARALPAGFHESLGPTTIHQVKWSWVMLVHYLAIIRSEVHVPGHPKLSQTSPKISQCNIDGWVHHRM